MRSMHQLCWPVNNSANGYKHGLSNLESVESAYNSVSVLTMVA